VKIPHPVLVSDIGGTNARFSFVKSPGAEPDTPVHVGTHEFPSLETALEKIFVDLPERPKSLIACAAGPIAGRTVKLTNAHWEIDGAKVAAATGLEQGLLFNDFEAQALSLPVIKSEWCVNLGGTTHEEALGARLILGPGTGLGVAALLEVGGRHFALASEGGHVAFGPIGAEQTALWPHIDTGKLGRVSAETLLCGPGTVRLHKARLAAAGIVGMDQDPASLVTAAHADTSGEEAATLRLFANLLARFAGDMALAFMAKGGVTFAGGMMPRIVDLIDVEDFRAHFEDKAPYGALMRNIETRLVTHDDVVLSGLAALAAAPERYIVDYAQRAWR
jgi:glucokinase